MWGYLENYFNLRKSFVFYGSYHHEWRNQLVHVTFVPAIFTTALSFLCRVKLTPSVDLSHVVATFYAGSFICMEPCAGILYAPVIAGMQLLASRVCSKHVTASVAVHLIGWIIQVLAHKYFEGRAPAFLEDPLQAIHAAVFFVWLEVLYYLGYRPKERDELDALVVERIAKLDAEAAAKKAAQASDVKKA